MKDTESRSLISEISFFLTKFVPIYLEFIRNIGAVITLLMIAFFSYFLVDLHYDKVSHPIRIEYFSIFMQIMAGITFLMNYIHFGNSLGNIIKTNNIRGGLVYKILIHGFMIAFAILILVAILYLTSIQGFKMVDGEIILGK
ncbi:hypothetical protein A1D22_01305 [Pasteurellaceae bacterium LFhippo2]|nr:hypothetical protein [Pasteurellaceae bacterium LFhippo2]